MILQWEEQRQYLEENFEKHLVLPKLKQATSYTSSGPLPFTSTQGLSVEIMTSKRKPGADPEHSLNHAQAS